MSRDIVVIAHNIRSLWNVGSLFRTCDAFAVNSLFLTGYTASPPRREISKTALGAEELVHWEYREDPAEVMRDYKKDGYRIVALEKTDTSGDLEGYEPPDKICLLLGQEVTGVSDEHLAMADDIVHIPMHGKKESLNVTVATGIALNRLRNS